MKRLVRLLLPAIMVASIAAPAQARWGTGFVDTWVTVDGQRLGEGTVDDMVSIHVGRSTAVDIVWTIRNLGGRPSTYAPSFDGCGRGGGFRIRYSTNGGRDVTYQVTHQGYDAKVLREGEKVSLVVEITAVPRSSRTCLLSAPATTESDALHLSLRSG